MVEKVIPYTLTDSKKVERLFEDQNAGINHMVLPQGDALPEHFANSHVYMIVVRGIVTLQLDEQPPHTYEHGNIVNIPFRTRMNVSNQHPDTLELFVVKAPSPQTMPR